jgi:hypothetical protein
VKKPQQRVQTGFKRREVIPLDPILGFFERVECGKGELHELRRAVVRKPEQWNAFDGHTGSEDRFVFLARFADVQFLTRLAPSRGFHEEIGREGYSNQRGFSVERFPPRMDFRAKISILFDIFNAPIDWKDVEHILL